MADEWYFHITPSTFKPTTSRGYRTGSEAVHPDGRRVTAGPGQEVNDLYLATEPAPPAPGNPLYYELASVDLSFTGTLNDPSGRVVRTNVWQGVSMDALREAKYMELDEHLQYVTLTNVQSSLAANWVYLSDLTRRLWISAQVQTERQERMANQTYGRSDVDFGSKDYHPRDIPIVGVNINTGRRLQQAVSEKEFREVTKDFSNHDFASSDAENLVVGDIESAYGDGTGTPGGPEWSALAGIDVTDSSYGWPPVWDGNGAKILENGRP